MCLECLQLDRFTRINARRNKPLNPCDSQDNKLRELVKQGKVRSNHEGLPNMRIDSDKSLPDLKRGNMKFGGSRGKMVFFQDKGSIVITLNM